MSGHRHRKTGVPRLLLMGLVILGTMMVLAACGSDEPETTEGGAAATPTPTIEAMAPTPTPTFVSDIVGTGPTPTPTPAGERAEYGGVLNYVSCCSGRVANFIDPYSLLGGNGGKGWLYTNSLVEMKFPFDPSKGVELIPGLAESWEVSADGAKWVFSLRRGVTWHDGEDFTADDVVATVERLLDTDGGIYVRQAPMRDIFRGVRKIDDYTIEIDTGEFNSVAFSYLSSHQMPILPAHYIVGSDPASGTYEERWTDFDRLHEENGQLMVGTGPFVMTEWTPEDILVLTRNESYWRRDDDGSQLPYLDGWTQTHVPDGTRRLARFAAGQEDYTIGQGAGLHPDKGEELCDNTRDDRCYVVPFPHGWFSVVLNHVGVNEWSDERMVAASRYALDAEEILQIAYGGRQGYIWMDRGRFPATAISFEEQYELLPWSDPTRRDEFKAAARDLITEAGFPDGYDLPLPIFSGGLCTGSFLDQYTRMVDNWHTIGIRGTLECREGIVAQDELRAGRFSIDGPGGSIFLVEPGYSYILRALPESGMVGNAPWRWEGQQELDRMFQETVRTVDEDERNEKWKESERFMSSPALTTYPMGYSLVVLSVHGCVRNFRPGGTWDSHAWSHERTWLEAECRES